MTLLVKPPPTPNPLLIALAIGTFILWNKRK